jgi:acyl-CoA synthetase (AMP-forming)/AMP-acid ligase II
LNQQYGLTELYGGFPAMAITHLPATWHRRKAGSCGRPVTGSVVRVVDESGDVVAVGSAGEVVVQTMSRVAGYWKIPTGVTGAYEDGWIRTGDVGCFDKDGFLYIHDRKNDMIISGALNVYPAEVEAAVLGHPAVGGCAVVGVPHATWVEVPWAVVVRKPGVPEVSEDDLIEFARNRIAHYKVPKRVVFVESLPTSSAGKILRRKVRDDLNELVLSEGK